MTPSEQTAAVEAMLFASGDPISLARMAQALAITPEAAQQTVDSLKERMRAENSGLTVLSLEDGYQMVSREEFAPQIRSLFELKRQTPLSQAALEVLSVVAYHQPVTKAYVEQVRGVDCSGVMATLVNKGLIAECGRLDLPGRPLVYGTTDVFLRCFSFDSLENLPPIPDPEEEPGGFAAPTDAQRQVLETKMEDFVAKEP